MGQAVGGVSALSHDGYRCYRPVAGTPLWRPQARPEFTNVAEELPGHLPESAEGGRAAQAEHLGGRVACALYRGSRALGCTAHSSGVSTQQRWEAGMTTATPIATHRDGTHADNLYGFTHEAQLQLRSFKHRCVVGLLVVSRRRGPFCM